MPVVIRELVIKAVVEEGASNSGSGAAASMKKVQEQEELIASCVEQVLEIIEKSKDR